MRGVIVFLLVLLGCSPGPPPPVSQAIPQVMAQDSAQPGLAEALKKVESGQWKLAGDPEPSVVAFVKGYKFTEADRPVLQSALTSSSPPVVFLAAVLARKSQLDKEATERACLSILSDPNLAAQGLVVLAQIAYEQPLEPATVNELAGHFGALASDNPLGAQIWLDLMITSQRGKELALPQVLKYFPTVLEAARKDRHNDKFVFVFHRMLVVLSTAASTEDRARASELLDSLDNFDPLYYREEIAQARIFLGSEVRQAASH